jgi:predicted acylesterase/phospholipase RssA
MPVSRLPAMHAILRWPLFLLVTLAVSGLLIIYTLVRYCVLAAESLLETRKIRKYLRRLSQAMNLQEYRKAARHLDSAAGLDLWKKTGDSPFFSLKLVESHTHALLLAKEMDDRPALIKTLKASLCDSNFGGVLNEALYSQSWDGTKTVVEEYLGAVTMGICHLRASLHSDPHDETLRSELIDLTSKSSYGRTALCLSGGGTIALQHIGVILTLIAEDICPNVICGTSGGAIVGAFFATRNSEEIRIDATSDNLLNISQAFTTSWLARLRLLASDGVLFNVEEAYEKLNYWCKGDMTFLEAFEHTGRTLNITVTTHDSHGDSGVLLNYLSAPDVIIRSAVLCSAAFPLFFKPVRLREKLKSGEIIHREALRYSDGSLVTDIPRDKLAAMFGVRFSIVSQVNPHVTPFLFRLRGDAGAPLMWRWGRRDSFRGGFILAALEVALKEQMKALVKIIRNLDLGPTVGGLPWVHVFLQNFVGDVTLVSNRSFIFKLSRALDNPVDLEELNWWIREGQLMTWPKITMIAARMGIENALLDLAREAGHKRLTS